MPTIVLIGGGTAGHVTPNIALLPALRDAGYDVHYIGTRDGIERELIAREGIPYHAVPCRQTPPLSGLAKFYRSGSHQVWISQVAVYPRSVSDPILFLARGDLLRRLLSGLRGCWAFPWCVTSRILHLGWRINSLFRLQSAFAMPLQRQPNICPLKKRFIQVSRFGQNSQMAMPKKGAICALLRPRNPLFSSWGVAWGRVRLTRRFALHFPICLSITRFVICAGRAISIRISTRPKATRSLNMSRMTCPIFLRQLILLFLAQVRPRSLNFSRSKNPRF